MGCCLSTAPQNKGTPKHHHFLCESKSPPTAEEETVKEVLSETPNPKPEPEPGSINILNNKAQEEGKSTNTHLALTRKKPPLGVKSSINYTKSPDPMDPDPYPVCTTPEETSDGSEMCIFNSTLRGGEARGNVYNAPKKHRSFSGGTSPVRRSDPSPTRKRNVGPVQGVGRRGPGDGLTRRDPAENSGRITGSPGTRSNVGRSPSGRKTGHSPGRVRMVQNPESERESQGGHWQGLNESLEDPLVSLECFIFL